MHSRATRKFIILMVGVMGLSFILRVLLLDNFRWGYDEGIHVLLAHLLAADYKPYSELFISYPPVFVWSLEYPWRIWHTVEALQLVMTVYSLLGVAAVGFIAYRLEGIFAGVAAAAFLSLSVIYLDGSRAVMTEVPSVGVATLAVAFIAQYYWSGHRLWLPVSGLITAVSLMLKILSPFIIGLVGLMILVYHWGQTENNPNRMLVVLQATIVDGIWWAVGVLIPVAVVILLYDAEAMYRQVVAFRFDSRIEYSSDWGENLQILFDFAKVNIPLALLTIWGLGVITAKRWRVGWFVLLWLILAIGFAMIQVPLREKHLPMLLPPIAVLAGSGVAYGWQTGVQKFKTRSVAGLVALIAVAMLTVGYAWQSGSELMAYQKNVTTPLDQNNQMLADYIRRYTAPTDCIISDNPTLIFYAERLTPPNLSEVSSARLRSGYLTYDELVEATEQYQCQVFAPIDKRLKRTRSDFVEWAKERYIGLWLYDGETEVLLGQPLTSADPQIRLEADFGRQVRLLGYDWFPPQSGAAYLSLYWQPLRPFERDYTVFVHVRDAAGNTVINADHQPYDGRVPTSRWHLGQVIKETIRLDVPPDLPTGLYTIYAGMYHFDGQNFNRLPLTADTSGENAVIISGFEVR